MGARLGVHFYRPPNTPRRELACLPFAACASWREISHAKTHRPQSAARRQGLPDLPRQAKVNLRSEASAHGLEAHATDDPGCGVGACAHGLEAHATGKHGFGVSQIREPSPATAGHGLEAGAVGAMAEAVVSPRSRTGLKGRPARSPPPFHRGGRRWRGPARPAERREAIGSRPCPGRSAWRGRDPRLRRLSS